MDGGNYGLCLGISFGGLERPFFGRRVRGLLLLLPLHVHEGLGCNGLNIVRDDAQKPAAAGVLRARGDGIACSGRWSWDERLGVE